MLEFDFSTLLDAFKNLFSVGISFYKALWSVLLKLWDLLMEVIGFARSLMNK